MTFNEITNPKKYARVLRDTYSDIPRKWMIGKEGEVSAELHYEGEVVVEHEGGKYCFNRSDLAFLTPIEFNGKRVGIGDWITMEMGLEDVKFLVIGYHWSDDEWRLDVLKDGELDCSFEAIAEDILEYHPQEKEDDQKMTDEDLIAELKRRGRIKNGEVID